MVSFAQLGVLINREPDKVASGHLIRPARSLPVGDYVGGTRFPRSGTERPLMLRVPMISLFGPAPPMSWSRSSLMILLVIPWVKSVKNCHPLQVSLQDQKAVENLRTAGFDSQVR